jgi:hypothetical protein
MNMEAPHLYALEQARLALLAYSKVHGMDGINIENPRASDTEARRLAVREWTDTYAGAFRQFIDTHPGVKMATVEDLESILTELRGTIH